MGDQSWAGPPSFPDFMSPTPTMSTAKNNPPINIPSETKGTNNEEKKMIYPGYKIRYGNKGEVVEAIQRRLGISTNGIFDRQLEEMVRRFQMDNSIQPSGNVGPKTWEQMFGSLNSPRTFAVKNDTEKDAVIVWTAKKCKKKMYGIPNVCHYELLLPGQSQSYEFDENSINRRVGILRKGSFRSLPLSSSVPDKHEFTVSSIKSSGIKLSRRPQRNSGVSRREILQRVNSMMNGVVSGVRDRFPF
jgi:hypothetical protein